MSEDVRRGWTTQRMANLLPGWSRARQEQDSVAQTILNPAGEFFDDFVSDTVQGGFNNYISTVSLSDFAFLHHLALPMDFEFQYEEHQAGKLTFLPPTVSATDGLASVSPTLIDRNKADSIDTDLLIPTRAEFLALTNLPAQILPPTLITALSGVAIDDTNLTKIGTLFIEISGGEIFGERDNRDHLSVPKVIIKGVPYMYGKTVEEEHIPFLTNTIKKSRYNWQEIHSVKVRGITGANTTIELSSGFLRSYVKNPYAAISTPLGEFPQVLSVETQSLFGGTASWLQYKTFELNSIELQRQGLSEQIIEHEVIIADGQQAPPPVVDIELVPNTRWLACVTQENLFLIDTRMPHPLGILPDESNVQNLLARAHTEKSLHPEMRLMTDKHDIINTETDGYVNLTTWHKKRIYPVVEVRLTGEFAQPGSPTTIKRFDAEGVAYDIGAAPNNGWIQSLQGIPVYDPKPRIEDWKDIAWAISPRDIVNNPVVIGLFTLEVKLSNGTIEKDTCLVWSLLTSVVYKKDLLPSMAGQVHSMTLSAEDKLVIRLTSGNCFNVEFSYDYYLIDYYKNQMWFLEEYDSVEVTS